MKEKAIHLQFGPLDLLYLHRKKQECIQDKNTERAWRPNLLKKSTEDHLELKRCDEASQRDLDMTSGQIQYKAEVSVDLCHESSSTLTSAAAEQSRACWSESRTHWPDVSCVSSNSSTEEGQRSQSVSLQPGHSLLKGTSAGRTSADTQASTFKFRIFFWHLTRQNPPKFNYQA